MVLCGVCLAGFTICVFCDVVTRTIGRPWLWLQLATTGFFGYGVEARHLRMYKTFAEREAAFLGQVVMPMANAKDPAAGTRAAEALTELARLGAALRLSMLRVGIGPPP